MLAISDADITRSSSSESSCTDHSPTAAAATKKDSMAAAVSKDAAPNGSTKPKASTTKKLKDPLVWIDLEMTGTMQALAQFLVVLWGSREVHSQAVKAEATIVCSYVACDMLLVVDVL
jgi:hypothetical protein